MALLCSMIATLVIVTVVGMLALRFARTQSQWFTIVYCTLIISTVSSVQLFVAVLEATPGELLWGWQQK